MNFSNGNRYEGEWLADKKHGKGIFNYASPRDESYFGDWVNNEEHGSGIYTYKDGSREKRDYRNGTLVIRVKL